MSKIISIDAETNGIWGDVFAIGGIVYEDGAEIDRICLRLSNEVVTNSWVIENVLSTLDFPVTHAVNPCLDIIEDGLANRVAYEEMLKDFSEWYMKHKDGTVLYHMGHIVESFLFREMHRLGFIGDWDAPYTPIEVADVLRENGFTPDSVDDYANNQGLILNVSGCTHNPLYDCEIAVKVYFDLKGVELK